MQQIDYSRVLNAFRISIREPFHKAAFILGWPDESEGLGISEYIINQCRQRGADLIVFVESLDKTFRISYGDLLEFLKTRNTSYFKGTALRIIALSWFSIYDVHTANKCVCGCGCMTLIQEDSFLCQRCVTHA